MTHRRKYILYGLVLLVSVIVFAVYLFPGDKIKTHMEIAFETNYPCCRLEINSVSPSLPLGIKLSQPRIDIDEANTFEAEAVTIGYRFFPLPGSRQSYDLKADAYDGAVKGVIRVAKNSPQNISANVRIDDIDVGEIKFVREKSNGQFAGRLSGDITFDSEDAKERAVFDLQVAKCKIPLIISFLNLGVIDFDEIRMNARLIRQNNLEISKCLLTGNQVDGEITGRVTLADDINQSRLNLTGTFKPRQEFLQTLPPNVIPSNMNTQKGIAFMVLGTIEKPSFSLR